MWRHTQALKCTSKGDFTTYPALICPLCNGYQGLSGNGAIKKDRERRGRQGERDRKAGGEGRWRSGRRKETGRKNIWQRRILEEQKNNGGRSQRDNGDKRES